jgi:hypothetical protein
MCCDCTKAEPHQDYAKVFDPEEVPEDGPELPEILEIDVRLQVSVRYYG